MSRSNTFYPYQTEEEMEAALIFLQKTNRISEVPFKIWLSTVDAMSAAMEKVDNSTSASDNKRPDAMSVAMVKVDNSTSASDKKRPPLTRLSSSVSNTLAGTPSVGASRANVWLPLASFKTSSYKSSTRDEEDLYQYTRFLSNMLML